MRLPINNVTKLGTRTNYVFASPACLDKHGIPHSLSELNQHSCLRGTFDYWHFIESGKEKNIRNGFELTDAALKGLGIMQLPDY